MICSLASQDPTVLQVCREWKTNSIKLEWIQIILTDYISKMEVTRRNWATNTALKIVPMVSTTKGDLNLIQSFIKLTGKVAHHRARVPSTSWAAVEKDITLQGSTHLKICSATNTALTHLPTAPPTATASHTLNHKTQKLVNICKSLVALQSLRWDTRAPTPSFDSLIDN